MVNISSRHTRSLKEDSEVNIKITSILQLEYCWEALKIVAISLLLPHVKFRVISMLVDN